MFKAVLWDFGGVITSSPFEAFNRFEAAHDLPKDIIRSINAQNPETNAWAQLESNAISLDVFDAQFTAEAQVLGYQLSGRQVLALLRGDIRPEMVQALERIRQTLKIACITNNVPSGKTVPRPNNQLEKQLEKQPEHQAEHTKTPRPTPSMQEVMAMFDLVIESSKLGIRKPDPRIYIHACECLAIAPQEAIFLDDLGINLKPARQLGMSTIKVISPQQALSDLEQLLGIRLACSEGQGADVQDG